MPLVDLAVDPVAAGLKPHEDPAQLFSLDFFPGTRLRSRALREGRHVPEPGSRHYTRPEPRMINRYVRMSPTLPPRVVRALLAVRRTAAGRSVGLLFYALALALEPWGYLRLVFRSTDRSLPRTLRVVRTFAANAFGKLYLRRLG